MMLFRGLGDAKAVAAEEETKKKRAAKIELLREHASKLIFELDPLVADADPPVKRAEDIDLMIAEVKCYEPGCPPLETVFAVLDKKNPRRCAVNLPLLAVEHTHVKLAVEAMARGEETCKCSEYIFASMKPVVAKQLVRDRATADGGGSGKAHVAVAKPKTEAVASTTSMGDVSNMMAALNDDMI